MFDEVIANKELDAHKFLAPKNASISPVCQLLRKREIWGKVDISHKLKAQLPLSKIDLYVEGIKTKKKTSNVFVGTGGYLGVSHDTNYLIGLNLNLSKERADMYFFDLFPQKAVMKHIVRMLEFPDKGFVLTYFPPKATHVASLVRDMKVILANPEGHAKGAPTSTESHVHIFIPSHCVHFTTFNVITQTRRFNKHGKYIHKDFLRIHDGGAILNCGLSLVNIQIMSELPQFQKAGVYTRKIWMVSEENGSPKINVDLGQYVAIAPSETQAVLQNEFVGLVPVASDKENATSSNGYDPDVIAEILAGAPTTLYISQQTVDIEKCIDLCMVKWLNTPQRHYKGFVDYECDILCVENNIAHLVVYTVVEIQITRRGDNIRNEFYVIRFEMSWDLFKGAVCRYGAPFVHQRLTPFQAYQPRSWFPLQKFPVEISDEMHYISNYPMFSGQNQKMLRTPNGNIEILCDQ